ncbi:leukocyte cell-derived chemotaxin-2-like, partial [Centroberyx affinis]|uniref:leukocyte cell-derived chemotaxin-2-like n=1 Tax=Centroberyx affinis TaxID=166261 RepID=UPI003A5C0670
RSVRSGPLCSGNPTNRRRTSDRWVEGRYGARRGRRLHKGLDIECKGGATVYAPFDMTLEGKVIVYTDWHQPQRRSSAIDNGISFTAGDICFYLWYMEPDKTSGEVKKGEKIGTMLNMQEVYSEMTSHVHLQRCDKSDPTRYL